MARRPVVRGDSVCIREECIDELARRFGIGVDVKAHAPMKVTDVETFRFRRLLHLDGGRMRVWPCEVHLADGPVETKYRRWIKRTNDRRERCRAIAAAAKRAKKKGAKTA